MQTVINFTNTNLSLDRPQVHICINQIVFCFDAKVMIIPLNQIVFYFDAKVMIIL